MEGKPSGLPRKSVSLPEIPEGLRDSFFRLQYCNEKISLLYSQKVKGVEAVVKGDKKRGMELRKIREKRGLGLRETARLSGVPYALLSQVETGKRYPTAGFLLKLSPVLGIHQDELLELFGYGRVTEEEKRLRRLAQEFEGVLFEYLEELASLGEEVKEDVIRMLEAILRQKKEERRK